MNKVLITKVRDVASPTRGTGVSSGLDFYIPMDIKPEDVKITPLNEPVKLSPERFVTEDEVIIPGGRGMLIPSGLKVKLPEGGDGFTYDLVLIGKSGVSVKTNLVVGAAVIDNDYRGEFNIHLINPGINPVALKKGAKVVQGIIRKCAISEIEEITTDEYTKYEETERGEGGFGSTGV